MTIHVKPALESGLSVRRIAILGSLALSPRNASALARELGAVRQLVTKDVNELIESGLVDKQARKIGSPVVPIKITVKGRAELKKLLA
jgi:DNA-binding MarR family transcriptional regulator